MCRASWPRSSWHRWATLWAIIAVIMAPVITVPIVSAFCCGCRGGGQGGLLLAGVELSLGAHSSTLHI